jgi:hypothetical protein
MSKLVTPKGAAEITNSQVTQVGYVLVGNDRDAEPQYIALEDLDTADKVLAEIIKHRHLDDGMVAYLVRVLDDLLSPTVTMADGKTLNVTEHLSALSSRRNIQDYENWDWGNWCVVSP